MPARQGSAAATVMVTPESAESLRQQLVAARVAAHRSSSRLAALCGESRSSLHRLKQAAAQAVEDASRVQGLASIVSRIP